MSLDRLDRLDRLVIAGSAPRATGTANPSASTSVELAGAPARPVVPASVSTFAPRGPRFVDYMPCPLCGHERVGIEFHGTLMSGAKVHALFSHSMGAALVRKGMPRCMGSGLRVVFRGGVWQGAPS
jgi:hypothetical protein